MLSKFGNGAVRNIDRFPEQFNSRRSAPFYRSFDALDQTVDLLKDRFPAHVSEVVAKAERIFEGYFDLLGYRGLRFREQIPDWHFEPVSGKTSPFVHWSKIVEVDAAETGDKKIIWELNRHQYFATLGQAYLLTGDERYAETFVSHVNDWCERNPPKMGVNWLSSLEVAFRSISWIWGLHFFRNSPSLTGDVLVRMLSLLHLNGRHLATYLSTYFSPNTHLTGEALGLYFLGTFLPELPEAARWRLLGQKILLDTLDVHIADDGVYCEQSSHYHRYTTDFYSNLLILLQLQGDQPEAKHLEKLRLLFGHLMHITQPNGRTPLFGDDDGGRFLSLDYTPIDDFRPTLALGAVLLGSSDLKFVARDAFPELLWLLGAQGLEQFDAIESTTPSETSRPFPSGGIYTVRTSWESDADHIVIDCGPHGFLNGGHAHADALNVILSIGGRPLFIDSGTYNYTSDPGARRRFRSSEAHNCLTIDRTSSSVPAGPFSWNSTARCRLLKWDGNEAVHFLGEHDGFKSLGLDYQREIELAGEAHVTITDHINSPERHLFELHFILAPGLSVEVGADSIAIAGENGEIAKMNTSVTGHGGGSQPIWNIDEWQVSFCYGAITATKRLRLAITGSGEISIVNQVVRSRPMSDRLQ